MQYRRWKGMMILSCAPRSVFSATIKHRPQKSKGQRRCPQQQHTTPTPQNPTLLLMCTITEHYGIWAMNIESGSPKSFPPVQRAEMNDAVLDGQSIRPGVGPEELPKGYTPRPSDVCCGRGKKNWRHHGNATFRKLIHANVAAYMDAATKHDKTLVVKSIVDIIRSNGGRFLKQGQDGGWYDIGDSQAREKVGHSLRDQVTALSKQKKDPSASGALPRRSSTPRRSSSSTSFSPHSQTSSSRAATSPSPLNIMSRLPTDLSGILEQIHFPSIDSSVPPPSNPLETSSSSFTTSTGQQSFLNNSAQNFSASFASAVAPVNFFEPLDESMEPTPIREIRGLNGQPEEERGPHHPGY